METIKISVEVNVNLSENAQNFIKSLLCNAVSHNAITQSTSIASASVEQPVLSTKSQTPIAKPAPSKPAVITTSEAPTHSATNSKDIEDVRKILAQKVNEHRDDIKHKLIELGAPSVTKLDPSKYDEMYNFLESL